MEQLFNFITNFVEITGNTTIDNVLLWIIGIISFSVSFNLVGMIFDAIGLYDSDLMSDCHWIIRLIVFVGLSSLLIALCKFIKWIFGFQWWIYLIAGIIIVGIIIFTFILKHKLSNKNLEKSINNTINTNENLQENKTEGSITKKDLCPRCGGKLIKRHGPCGNFYGCENFSTTNCRYTRKFK